MESKVVYDVFHLVYWDWRIAMDLFLGGLAVGAFIFSAAVMFYRKNDQLVSVKAGSILAPIGMTAGLLFMLSEMGEPLRIYKTLARFNLTSTLSWGGLLQEIFIALSSIFAFLLLTKRTKYLEQGFAVLVGLFAVFVAFYHGFLLSFVTARPIWNSGAVNVASVITSMVTGMAAVLLLISFSSAGRKEIEEMKTPLRSLLIFLLLMQVSTCFIWLITLVTGKADFVNAFTVLNRNFGILFWFGAITIGMLLPTMVLMLYSVGARREKGLPVLLTSILILAGNFVFRYVLVLAGQIS